MMHPRLPVRRFDVFAEYTRQKAIKDGMPEDEAAGYGLWVAKVVASRGFGRGAGSGSSHNAHDNHDNHDNEGEKSDKPKWHSLDNKPQTDELFNSEIVRRMGPGFYDEVFVPAIRDALEQDKTYTSIRDTIRREWKP